MGVVAIAAPCDIGRNKGSHVQRPAHPVALIVKWRGYLFPGADFLGGVFRTCGFEGFAGFAGLADGAGTCARILATPA